MGVVAVGVNDVDLPVECVVSVINGKVKPDRIAAFLHESVSP